MREDIVTKSRRPVGAAAIYCHADRDMCVARVRAGGQLSQNQKQSTHGNGRGGRKMPSSRARRGCRRAGRRARGRRGAAGGWCRRAARAGAGTGSAAGGRRRRGGGRNLGDWRRGGAHGVDGVVWAAIDDERAPRRRLRVHLARRRRARLPQRRPCKPPRGARLPRRLAQQAAPRAALGADAGGVWRADDVRGHLNALAVRREALPLRVAT
mmetsp:Transcript_4164/g.13247  ORF Transcript_4164/g.13247 Transcript_4164/m.13247 type:complete len:211 (-) Transcript_4164:1629-2261(-)